MAPVLDNRYLPKYITLPYPTVPLRIRLMPVPPDQGRSIAARGHRRRASGREGALDGEVDVTLQYIGFLRGRF